jgi:hypothetical protein
VQAKINSKITAIKTIQQVFSLPQKHFMKRLEELEFCTTNNMIKTLTSKNIKGPPSFAHRKHKRSSLHCRWWPKQREDQILVGELEQRAGMIGGGERNRGGSTELKTPREAS